MYLCTPIIEECEVLYLWRAWWLPEAMVIPKQALKSKFILVWNKNPQLHWGLCVYILLQSFWWTMRSSNDLRGNIWAQIWSQWLSNNQSVESYYAIAGWPSLTKQVGPRATGSRPSLTRQHPVRQVLLSNSQSAESCTATASRQSLNKQQPIGQVLLSNSQVAKYY